MAPSISNPFVNARLAALPLGWSNGSQTFEASHFTAMLTFLRARKTELYLTPFTPDRVALLRTKGSFAAIVAFRNAVDARASIAGAALYETSGAERFFTPFAFGQAALLRTQRLAAFAHGNAFDTCDRVAGFARSDKGALGI